MTRAANGVRSSGRGPCCARAWTTATGTCTASSGSCGCWVRWALTAGEGPAPYAYLIYPHKPIVAYVPATGELLNEYCITFPDHSKPFGSPRLPHSDDVLAKWMAITADERRLIGEANMHLPGRQVDPERIRRDLARLTRWERERAERELGGARAA